jgi:uroporphyrinogen-III synthase
VLVPRAVGQSNELVEQLRAAGFEPVVVPAIAIALEPAGGALDRALSGLADDGWIVVTSANGAQAALAAVERAGPAVDRLRWAVIGRATADVLARAGIGASFQPSVSRAGVLADELPVGAADHVLVVRGDLADADVAVALRTRGASVDDVVAYRTEEAPAASRELLRAELAAGPIDAIAFTSGSTVRGLIALGSAAGWDPRTVPAICIGPETARIATELGFEVRAVASTPDASALATATTAALAPTSLEMT